jgi:hypothetical protein
MFADKFGELRAGEMVECMTSDTGFLYHDSVLLATIGHGLFANPLCHDQGGRGHVRSRAIQTRVNGD